MSRNTHRAPKKGAAATAGALTLTAALLVWHQAATPTSASAAESRGANAPYTTYEAEAGDTNASSIGPSRTFGEPASEASGRKAVVLKNTGDYVEFKLTQDTNALNLRYSLPDSADGKGRDAKLSAYADGAKLTDLNLTSRYAWVYGAYPYNNDPSQGSPHRFFDETRTLLDRTLTAGTVLRLQKDQGNDAESYTIDLLEAEQAPDAAAMPDGYLSAADLGVTPGAGDVTTSLTDALATAKSQGKGLWLPAGDYTISGRVQMNGVDLRGAGMWHTVLHGTGIKGGLFAHGGTNSIQDLMIDGDTAIRDDQAGDAAIEGVFAPGSVIKNVWIQHTKVGLWTAAPTDGLHASNLRVRNTFADGVNFHKGTKNAVVSNSTFRGTGDDAMAMYSEEQAVTGSSFRDNTIQLPMLANGAAIYGGADNSIENNDISDTVTASAGIAISTRNFGPGPLPFTGPATVSGNTLTRTGGYEPNWQAKFGAIWVFAERSDITTPVIIENNDVRDSTYSGLLVSYQKTVSDLTVKNTQFDTNGAYGIEINSAGKGAFSGVTVSGAADGGLSQAGGFEITRGEGNSGW